FRCKQDGFLLCFFFQAEDGIRDRNVTGVQTCALPIFIIATASVIPNCWKKTPVEPEIKVTGTKIADITKVIDTIAPAISLMPSTAASMPDSAPSSNLA